MASCASLSARRAWIEIHNMLALFTLLRVALRKESVDRNRYKFIVNADFAVALRKESVDRNLCYVVPATSCPVALRKESVDRNSARQLNRRPVRKSLSARRAWIEISVIHCG